MCLMVNRGPEVDIQLLTVSPGTRVEAAAAVQLCAKVVERDMAAIMCNHR